MVKPHAKGPSQVQLPSVQLAGLAELRQGHTCVTCMIIEFYCADLQGPGLLTSWTG
jgi:hypothetical protein